VVVLAPPHCTHSASSDSDLEEEPSSGASGFDSPETHAVFVFVSTGTMHSNTMHVQRVVPTNASSLSANLNPFRRRGCCLAASNPSVTVSDFH
jgi:hypothetical protein